MVLGTPGDILRSALTYRLDSIQAKPTKSAARARVSKITQKVAMTNPLAPALIMQQYEEKLNNDQKIVQTSKGALFAKMN